MIPLMDTPSTQPKVSEPQRPSHKTPAQPLANNIEPGIESPFTHADMMGFLMPTSLLAPQLQWAPQFIPIPVPMPLPALMAMDMSMPSFPNITQPFPQLNSTLKDKGTYYELKLPVGSIPKDNIEIKTKQNHLIIRGRQKHSEKHQDANHYQFQTQSGLFQHLISIPQNANPKQLTSQLKDNTLILKMPKKQ